MISGSQQSSDLKDALESENEKTKLMEESMQKLDEEMKRSDILLAQMMPKSVSDKVREANKCRL
jgi:guanylate cyclase